MRRTAVLALLLTSTLFAQTPTDKPLFGFNEEGAKRQRELEKQFDAKLNRENLRTWLTRIAARPHHLGSPHDRANVEYIASLFRSWGYDTQIESFNVLFPTPKTRVVELIAPERFVAKLDEPALAQDSTSSQKSEQLPSYNAYSIDGDVTGELVYVNYGLPRDYDELERRGIDVKGKIVIVRYGASWRGIKPKVAAEHGAIGCLIYSDPRDDGYFAGDVYPRGAFRSDLGVQRGSVVDMPFHPGDPLTPGVGATADAKRLDRKDAITLTKIPVLPISYSDAQPLLRALGGPVAPEGWRGALPITYHLGPGPAKVHMKLEFDWKLVAAQDVIARLTGSEEPNQWVMRGNHHDGWVNGASDPVSGLVAMMEEARAIGELAKSGQRPKRTIVYGAWGGEEQGLLGSTEWVETHRDELQRHLVTYINSDGNTRGFLDAGGSHTLERLVTEVARDVVDPQTNVSVLERARARDLAAATTADARKELRDRELLRLDALGSGSDYTPFLQHATIASLHIGYSGESDGGEYHSIYDSIDHFTRFGDPGFVYGVTQAQTTGRLTLRLANADRLPFETATLASTIARYAEEVTKLAADMRAETEEKNRQIRERTLDLAADPTLKLVTPKPKEPVPHLEFAPLQNAVMRLQNAAKTFDRAAAAGAPRNRFFQRLEQSLASANGLPRRGWYKHSIYAPGFYTGYGVKTLPAIREAIEQRNWSEANEQIGIVSKVIDGYAAELERVAKETP